MYNLDHNGSYMHNEDPRCLILNVKKTHPQFPTRAEVLENAELAYSDHLTIWTQVPLGDDKKPLNIISLNVLGSINCSGIHPQGFPDTRDNVVQNYTNRYKRIASGLKKGVANNQVDMVLLQEADRDALKAIKEELEADWEFIDDTAKTGIISCYKKNRLQLLQTSLNNVTRVRSMHFTDGDNANMTVDVHKIWGIYSHFPDSMENTCKTALLNSQSQVSVILGDTNSRIAPLDNQKRNLTTGLIPAALNYVYGLPEEQQLTDFPDGGFYRSVDGSIHQLQTVVLDFAEGTVVPDNRLEQEFSVSKDYRMVMCLDESYQTKIVVNNQTIFEYQKLLQDILKVPSLLVRIASDSFNDKALAIRLPSNSPLCPFIRQRLGGEQGFQLQEGPNYDGKFVCAFIALDKADLLHKCIVEYQSPILVQQLRSYTASCLREVGRFRDAHKVLKALNAIFQEKILPEATIDKFYQLLSVCTDGKNNLQIIEDDKSMSTCRFIAGIVAISAIIVTGVIPGLLMMGFVYAITKKLPHHLFKPHEEGKKFGNSVTSLLGSKNSAFFHPPLRDEGKREEPRIGSDNSF